MERCHQGSERTSDQARRWVGLESMRPALRSYLSRRCRDPNEADDIIQDTLVRAARYRGSLADGERLRSWILRIAANVLRDHARRTSRSPCVGVEDDVLDRVDGASRSGEGHDDGLVEVGPELLDREALLWHLRRAYAGLAERDRTVLRSYYEGVESCAVTGLECGLAPALVKVRLFRARRRLERAIRSSLARRRTAL